jgi:HEAT repeat protein
MKRVAGFALIFIFVFCFCAYAMADTQIPNSDKVLVYSMAVDALGKIGDIKAKQCLLDALRSREFFVRAYAARALGLLGDKSVIPELKGLVKDKHYLVRIMAVKALIRLGDADAEKTLLGFLADKDESVRSTAISDLSQFGIEFVPVLLDVLKKEKDPLVRAKALEELSNEKFPPTLACGKKAAGGIDARIRAIRKALNDKSWETRQSACYAIARFEDKDSIPLLIKRLDDESVYVRAAAKSSLGKLGQKSLIKRFREDLGSKDHLLKVSSIIALSYLKDTSIIPELLKEVVAPKNDIQVRKEAVKALIMLKPEIYKILDNNFSGSGRYSFISSNDLKISYAINGKDLALIFIYALEDPKNQLHDDAAFVLGELDNELVLPSLRNALFNSSPELVANVVFVLGDLKDKEAVEGLIKICKEYQI